MILTAAADEIVESGIEALSLHAVADRAGVSKRTLYNYFDSRETLFAELNRWTRELTLEMGGVLEPPGLDTIDSVVATLWQTWKAQGNLQHAGLLIDAATNGSGISEGRQRRHDVFVTAVEELRPELDPHQHDELASLIHTLTSTPVYKRLAVEDGIDVDRAATLVSWTIGLIRTALANGENP